MAHIEKLDQGPKMPHQGWMGDQVGLSRRSREIVARASGAACIGSALKRERGHPAISFRLLQPGKMAPSSSGYKLAEEFPRPESIRIKRSPPSHERLSG